jgi:hypothetical protein
MRRCVGAYRHTGIEAYRHTGIQAYRHTGAYVRRCVDGRAVVCVGACTMEACAMGNVQWAMGNGGMCNVQWKRVQWGRVL